MNWRFLSFLKENSFWEIVFWLSDVWMIEDLLIYEKHFPWTENKRLGKRFPFSNKKEIMFPKPSNEWKLSIFLENDFHEKYFLLSETNAPLM